MEPIFNPVLGILAVTVDDLEEARKAAENRLRSLTMSLDKGGFGLPDSHPSVVAHSKLTDSLRDVEKAAIKELEKAMKASPLGPWVMNTKGIGLKTCARLLASIGDPYWNGRDERPRLVSELWAYCGFHVHDGAAVHHTKGSQGNWSDTARKRAWIMTGTPIKTGGPYREVYDKGRAKYQFSVHQRSCKRCGPKGLPALPGSPLSASHQHARAVRLMSKEILKDLWRESKRIHEEEPK